MGRIAFILAAVFLALSAVIVLAQENEPGAPASLPAAVRSQADCAGFIAETPVARNLSVVGGADDDFRSTVRQFVEGESIFISQRGKGDIAVGSEYRVVRPGKEIFRTTHYQGQGADLKKLGKPYEDIAKIQVTRVGPEGAVAKIVFSCQPIVPGDALVPFQPRAVPQYTVTKPLAQFIPLDKYKQYGRITASPNNSGSFGRETIVYVDLGERQGNLPGRRLRIYKVLPPEKTGFMTGQRTPPETVGEAIVLSVEWKSCVAMIVSSYREISVGDYVELE